MNAVILNFNQNVPNNDPVCVSAPPSKSEMQRMLVAASLSDKETDIFCSEICEDVETMMNALSAFGADFTVSQNKIRVSPINRKTTVGKNVVVDLAQSGMTARTIIPLASVLGIKASFICDDSLANRPFSPIFECLEKSGVSVNVINGFPNGLSGKPNTDVFEIDGSISSQFVSGMLLSLPALGRPSVLKVKGKKVSSGYIEMTLDILRRFNVSFEIDGDCYRINSGYTSPGVLYAEGDWSNAAFFLVAGIIGKRPVRVNGISLDSHQGDKKIIDFLTALSANIEIGDNCATGYPSELTGAVIDAEKCPDLVPPLCAAAAVAKGRTVIKGISRLRYKESDRIKTVSAMLCSVGISCESSDDVLVINGGKPVRGIINSYGDHRIAMSGALFSVINGETIVIDSDCVKKSDPLFFEKAKLLSDVRFTEGRYVVN